MDSPSQDDSTKSDVPWFETEGVQNFEPFEYTLDWNLTTDEIIEQANKQVSQLNATINSVIDLEEPRTFENTIIPIANLEANTAEHLSFL